MDIRSRLGALDTCALSDALDRAGIHGQAVGIVPMDRSMRFVGQAFTVRMLPTGLSGKSVGDYIDEVAEGQVVVIDNAGRLDATVWGDILTTTASRNKVAGTVIDGVCRDAERSCQLNYPLFARANTMRTGKDRVSAEDYGVAVQLAGVRVEPDDWLVGDADGVVVIPAGRVDEVIGIAEHIVEVEEAIRTSIHAGERLDRSRQQTGYHALQTRGGNG